MFSLTVRDEVSHPYKTTGNGISSWSLYVLVTNWNTKDSAPSGDRHFLTSICSSFLHEWNFYSLGLFQDLNCSTLSVELLSSFMLWFCAAFSSIDMTVYIILLFPLSSDSAVGIATCYRPEGPGIESQWGEIFRTYPDRLQGPPSLLYNGYRVFPGGKGDRGVMMTTHTFLVPRLRKSWAIPPLTLWVLLGLLQGSSPLSSRDCFIISCKIL